MDAQDVASSGVDTVDGAPSPYASPQEQQADVTSAEQGSHDGDAGDDRDDNDAAMSRKRPREGSVQQQEEGVDAADGTIAAAEDEHEKTAGADELFAADAAGDGNTGSYDEEADAATSQPAKKKKKKQEREENEDRVSAPPSDGDAAEARASQMSEQDRRRQEMMRKIDLAAKGPRKRPKKKADETDLEAVADDEVVRMRDMMQAAAMEDREANEEHRPATAKLRMLRDAVETLQKTGYQQAILDNNLLEAVKMWLEPLPDGSLPSLNIQRALFPLLDRMYIDSTSLKMSGLGKLVLFYTRCKRVDRSILRIADRLLESWSRPILKRSSSYRDRQQAVREYRADPQRSMQRAVQDSQSARTASAASQRARIPESVTGNAFRFAPVAAASDAMDDSQLAKLAEKQRINKFKRSMAAAKR